MISTTIYDEDVEWVFSSLDARYNAADNSNPHTGLIDLLYSSNVGGAAVAGAWTAPSPVSSSLITQLSLWISPTNWVAGKTVKLTWFDQNGTQTGNSVTIQNGTFGFNTGSNVYQNIVIPVSTFAIPSGGKVGSLGIVSSSGIFSYFLDTVVLSLMSVNCDPSALANASVCFSQCISDPLAVRTYLLCQYLTACRAPLAPTNLALSAGANNPGSNSMTIQWSQPLQIGGPTITGYLVKWGTASGNYNVGQAMLPAAPLSYTITGLTPSTTYFVVVEAVATSCPSSNSNELNATTTALICNPGALTQAWVAAVIANGGAAPSMTTQCAVDAFYTGMAADGNDVLMGYTLPLVPDSLIAALTPLYRANNNGNALATNHGFVNADLTVNGLKGDGVAKYIDTGVQPPLAPFSDGSAGLILYVSSNVAEAKLDFGVQGTPANSEFAFYPVRNTGSGFYSCWFNNAGLVTGTAPATFSGYQAGFRTTTTRSDFYFANSITPHQNGGNSLGNGGSAVAFGAFNILVFNEGIQGTGPSPGNYSSKTLSFISTSIGATAAQSQKIFNRIQAFRVALGGGFV